MFCSFFDFNFIKRDFLFLKTCTGRGIFNIFLATLFINGSTGNILYRMNMSLAFTLCGIFMIAVGNLCPNKYNMQDISS